MRGVLTAMLIAAGLALAGCGEPEPAQDPAAEAAAAAEAQRQADLEAGANTLFASTCNGLNMDGAICACVRDRIVGEAGLRGLLYIAAAFGPDPTMAGPLEAEMSQDERNDAAEAFLNGQFDCVIATDPDFAAPDPSATPDADPESPLEQTVAACVESAAAGEPECRCRAETVFDTMGEDGVALALADARGDSVAMRDLAQQHGGAWLDQGQDALEAARLACRL